MAATRERRPAGRRDDGLLVNALAGAVVSVVLAFVPFSPLLGGAVAGYLQKGDERTGLKVGAVSGGIASVPVLAVLVLLLAVASFVVVVPDGAGVALPFAFAGLAVTVAVVLLLYVVALSAVGGAVGAAVARERARGRSRATSPPVRTTPDEAGQTESGGPDDPARRVERESRDGETDGTVGDADR